MNQIESCIPPGFRFHPTEEELVGYYLKRKINSQKIDLNVIIDIDLYRMEPWQIQEKCSRSGNEEENEWYFFSYKDRKYPSGTRTNRATSAGFWKATGRDKAVLSNDIIIGMRKTLVFYKGRAPNGQKTDWIMHEYRLQISEHAPSQEEGWVVCRAFKKPTPSHNQNLGAWNNHNNNNYYSMTKTNSNTPYNNNNTSTLIMNSSSVVQDPTTNSSSLQAGSSTSTSLQTRHANSQHFASFEQEFTSMNNSVTLMDLTELDSPSISTSLATENGFDQQMSCGGLMSNIDIYEHEKSNSNDNNKWEIVDSLLGSQVSEVGATSWFSNAGDYDQLEAHNNQMTYFFECFPNL